jgi:hypothetical protein
VGRLPRLTAPAAVMLRAPILEATGLIIHKASIGQPGAGGN